MTHISAEKLVREKDPILADIDSNEFEQAQKEFCQLTVDEQRSALLNVDVLPEVAEELLQPTGKCKPMLDILETDSVLKQKIDQRCGDSCKKARNDSTVQLAALELILEEKFSNDLKIATENLKVILSIES